MLQDLEPECDASHPLLLPLPLLLPPPLPLLLPLPLPLLLLSLLPHDLCPPCGSLSEPPDLLAPLVLPPRVHVPQCLHGPPPFGPGE